MTMANPTSDILELSDRDDTAARVREAFNRNRRKMTPQLAEELGVSERDVVRYLPDDLSAELDLARLEALVTRFETLGEVRVLTNNGTATLEVLGKFGGYSHWGPYFNVQTESLDMHIRLDRIAAAFAVVKPSHMDGHNTLSFQFFDAEGKNAFKVFVSFGGDDPGELQVARFLSLREEFRKP